jgi:hypothetical protein
MLAMIATYEPDHIIFQKGYMPAKGKPGGHNPKFNELLIANDDGLFTNLPPSKAKPNKRFNYSLLTQ